MAVAVLGPFKVMGDGFPGLVSMPLFLLVSGAHSIGAILA